MVFGLEARYGYTYTNSAYILLTTFFIQGPGDSKINFPTKTYNRMNERSLDLIYNLVNEKIKKDITLINELKNGLRHSNDQAQFPVQQLC